MEVPGGGNTEIVIPIIIVPVVDIQPVVVEVDVDAVAVRGEILPISVRITEKLEGNRANPCINRASVCEQPTPLLFCFLLGVALV